MKHNFKFRMISDEVGCCICGLSEPMATQLGSKESACDLGLAERRRVRHKKRGTQYSITIIGTLQTDEPLSDGATLVGYIGNDGKWWFRTPEEVVDGRFEHAEPLGGKPLKWGRSIKDVY